ncbi:HAD superfamily hydrolase (TIGR01490 family) [Vibrio sp. ES.051]|uniref:HAD family hydrolase n=1 Tax=Vibrio sp. ES.051 TaxID=1761909 RepID=UPI000BF6648E|nr:HAD family hydrolase [Vibrio sp. ES.051]PFG58330.1 HAD superfamily hydrolase (TIGR01490 family) [Vibrio sp. ES.051]
MSKPLYVFDLDETLIKADCSMIWNEFLVEKGIVTDRNFIEEDRRLMNLYVEGEMDIQCYLDFSLEPLATIPKKQISELVEECVKRYILPKQFTQSKSLIERLIQDEVDIIIVSASVTFLVEVVARHLGIKTALGIDLIEQQACYSSEINGIATYREGKVTRLEQWLNETAQSFSEIHFFTDSINDLPLCEYADYTYLVNPSLRLRTIGVDRNWPILSWGA